MDNYKTTPMMNMTLRADTVYSERASLIPGDNLRVLTEDALALDGSTLPKGTRYQPGSAGMDNVSGVRVQRVFVLYRQQ